ncbi:head decoration protein [Nocardia sp. NPDC059246]|uniref:head decoration protein n=1 Tax=unclassified Nocardia TaxID=2637762 RepID=UPI00369D456A
MTSISVKQNPTFRGENRKWLIGLHGTDPSANPSVTLDVSKFTQATHYPDGFIASGMVLGQVTATKRYGPYDAAASDGRQIAVGFLFGTLPVTGETKVGGALVKHGFVDAAQLPANNGLDAAARTALKLIDFTN